MGSTSCFFFFCNNTVHHPGVDRVCISDWSVFWYSFHHAVDVQELKIPCSIFQAPLYVAFPLNSNLNSVQIHFIMSFNHHKSPWTNKHETGFKVPMIHCQISQQHPFWCLSLSAVQFLSKYPDAVNDQRVGFCCNLNKICATNCSSNDQCSLVSAVNGWCERNWVQLFILNVNNTKN